MEQSLLDRKDLSYEFFVRRYISRALFGFDYEYTEPDEVFNIKKKDNLIEAIRLFMLDINLPHDDGCYPQCLQEDGEKYRLIYQCIIDNCDNRDYPYSFIVDKLKGVQF